MSQAIGRGLIKLDPRRIESKEVKIGFIILRAIVVISLICLILFGPIIVAGLSEKVYFYASDDSSMNEITDFLFRDGNLTSFSEAEVSHMEDVLDLLAFSQYFLILIIIVLLVYFFLFEDKLVLKIAGLSGLSIQLILFVWILLNFESAFDMFHKTFFPMGNYTFPSSSGLIQIFPIEFFFWTALVCSVISLFGFLFCYYKGTR